MAEFVQQSACQIREELDQIENLTVDEKRNILKKRVRLEYRIRKRTKNEKDFIQYIEYEKDVLNFVRKRKRAGRSKRRTEVPIIMRIHQLYQLCETRFPQNVDTWLSHIEFCKQQKEYRRVNRLFTQMLRTHSAEPELWVKAATWEADEMNFEAARALMQRCVNFNKTSRLAWVEYYRLELLLAKLEQAGDTPNGKLAEVVCELACQEFPDDVELLFSLIGVSEKYEFARQQREGMLKQLRESFSHLPRVWDFLARRLLPSKKRKLTHLHEKQEERFFTVYQEAVMKVSTTEMWTLYLKACLELIAVPAPSEDRVHKRVQRALEVFKTASDRDCLSCDMFQAWVLLLKDVDQVDEAVKVSELMIQRYPDSAAAWLQSLLLKFQTLTSADDVISCLNKALRVVPEKDSWCLWEPVLLYLAAASHHQLEPLLERACQRLVREVCMPAKLLYLRWTALTKSIKATRVLYKRLSALKPVPLDFYLEYGKQELMQDEVKMNKVRRAYEDAISDYGKTEPDVWLHYIHTELTKPNGDPAQASVLHSRATVNLPQGVLRDSFLQRYGAVVSLE